MSGLSIEAALEQLKPREPIFHRRSYGTSRDALEAMIDEGFWEVGASGRVYRREYVISNLLERYKSPEPHDWPCRDFSIHELAENLFLLHYMLTEPDRMSRRTTIWKYASTGWKIVFHQGTIISADA
jgi:hypothetical protein